MRAPAKRYLRSLGLVDAPQTEPECVAALIDSHQRQRKIIRRPKATAAARQELQKLADALEARARGTH